MISEELKQKMKDWRADVRYWGRSPDGDCGTLEGFLSEAMEEIEALEAKANAFDALEGLVKERHYVDIAEDFDALFSVVWTVSTTRGAGDIGQGQDLQSAINDAVGKEIA